MSWDTPDRQPAARVQAARLRRRAARSPCATCSATASASTHNTYDRDLENNQPYPLLAEQLSSAPMACTPGDCYAYQNVAFSLIGDLVFAVDRRLLLAPGREADLPSARHVHQPPTAATRSRTAPAGRARTCAASGGWVPVRPKETYYRVPPAAGVNSSIHDMAQWLIAQTGHRPTCCRQSLLDADPHAAGVHAGRAARLAAGGASACNGACVRDWAGGCSTTTGHTMVFHGGAVQGYRGLIALPAARGRRHRGAVEQRERGALGPAAELHGPRAGHPDQGLARRRAGRAAGRATPGKKKAPGGA